MSHINIPSTILPIVLRFIDRMLVSFMPSCQDNSSILGRSSLTPLPHIMIFPFVVVLFLLGSSSLDYWNILALRLLLHGVSRLLMPCWMKALGPNTIAMCMVPWLLRFLMALRMMHWLSKLQEALVEEDEIQAMEQDVPIPKVALSTHSS